ncbi:MAG: EVE domain-containing protein [Xanthobacteraceae bacterium]|nr:EVE domain-containing protein [Xanthobacteraceae bacterium]
MAYWLVKSEPDSWSWDQQVKAGAKGTEWTGVRNHTAKQNLQKMKKGDRAFFYHSNVGKDVVGIVEVIREAHPDPTAKGEPWVVVDFKAVEPVPQPVSLEMIKHEPKLKEMALIKYSRLSVQPVTADEWKQVCKMGGVKG